jgi:hypothetical protein
VACLPVQNRAPKRGTWPQSGLIKFSSCRCCLVFLCSITMTTEGKVDVDALVKENARLKAKVDRLKSRLCDERVRNCSARVRLALQTSSFVLGQKTGATLISNEDEEIKRQIPKSFAEAVESRSALLSRCCSEGYFDDYSKSSLAVFVIGASGDLAWKKTFPALFSLSCQGLLPPHAIIAGYARSPIADADFKKQISRA